MMKTLSNWRDKAVCSDSRYPERWLSYKMSDIKYAKQGCLKCSVRSECLLNAIQNDFFVGVVAGISEFDYLMYTWQETTREDESNWRTDDRVLSELLQRTR